MSPQPITRQERLEAAEARKEARQQREKEEAEATAKEQTEIKERQQSIDADPTEFLPVMRHHLHESLYALNLALGYVEATDLAEGYRQGLSSPYKSALARQLDRAHTVLAGYLGLLDESEEEDGG
jgi:hypothetical protein